MDGWRGKDKRKRERERKKEREREREGERMRETYAGDEKLSKRGRGEREREEDCKEKNNKIIFFMKFQRERRHNKQITMLTTTAHTNTLTH